MITEGIVGIFCCLLCALHLFIMGHYNKTYQKSEDNLINEFGSRVLEELFQMLPCEKVLIRKTDLGEDLL